MDLTDLKLDKPTTIVRLYNGDENYDKGIYEIDYIEKVDNYLDLILLGYRHSGLSPINICYEYFYGDNAVELAITRIKELKKDW